MTISYQIAVEFEKDFVEDRYKSLRQFYEIMNKQFNQVGLSPREKGKYDYMNHTFYRANNDQDARTFATIAKQTGLVKAIHIDEINEIIS